MAIDDAKTAKSGGAGLTRLVNILSSGRILEHGRDWLANSRAGEALHRVPWPAGISGRSSGRPLREQDVREACRLIEAGRLFDRSFYLERYPEVAATGLDPLRHYVERGAAEGRDPHPLFDRCRFYLRRHPDPAAAGINPLLDYLGGGAARGLDPCPLFDSSYYLETYPDVAAAGINPLLHFMQWGAIAGRKPNPLFDTPHYLATYPEAAAAGGNPLVHSDVLIRKESGLAHQTSE